MLAGIPALKLWVDTERADRIGPRIDEAAVRRILNDAGLDAGLMYALWKP